MCRLKMSLYGLKQAPRAWYARIDGHLMSLGFNKSVVDPNLYYKIVNGESLILVLYIDDLFLTGTKSLIVECKYALASEFEMKDLGMMHYFLGLEVGQRTDEIFLSQGKYTVEILKKFGRRTPIQARCFLESPLLGWFRDGGQGCARSSSGLLRRGGEGDQGPRLDDSRL